MGQREALDYLFLSSEEGRKCRMEWMSEELAGIQVMRVKIIENKRAAYHEHCRLTLVKKYFVQEGIKQLFSCKSESQRNPQEEKLKKLQKKIIKHLQDYQTSQCVVGADSRMAELFFLQPVLFAARKQEFIQNEHVLFELFETGSRNGRKSFLLVLDSINWTQQELMQLLLVAKDYYETLNVTILREETAILNFAEHFYEEWGIVLHICSEETVCREHMDFAVFLMENWRGRIQGYCFTNAYVVLEDERGISRQRQQFEDIRGVFAKEDKGNLYSGFVYERQGVSVPYQMAVNIAHQNLALYQKFALSSVAIYRLEC